MCSFWHCQFYGSQDSPLLFVKNRKGMLENQISASDAEDIVNDVRKAVPALGYDAVRSRVSLKLFA